jgi:hypothetical protein
MLEVREVDWKGSEMPSGYVMPYRMSAPPAPRRPSLRLRARVWLKGFDRDAQLARGVDPSRSEELRLRAQQLRDPKRRAKLADAIDRLVSIAERRSRAEIITPQAPFMPWQVLANRELLHALSERVRHHRRPSLQGLAMTSLLLRNARRALFRDDGPLALERAASAALSALDVDRERTHVGARPRPRSALRGAGPRAHTYG